ncbi:uncharacterized protein SETTUDRAFT_158491 [Exserohilum turcica Et28A]|uniref:Uncharacterized protein n=1 Tax=Exserohilum turcicum (strain 28A) TaxID=671987 RepID=R0J2M9_EXST2|nr:uncharacterized protein SETTUDRAFT_158491 [Exserohilum turcica Et28A]EOA91011.1 hypothetical protein SETTUDRAFT_158491 [Exserohilum turcica Et28A]
MSTTYLSIHDLLRITYTYEMQAVEAQARVQQEQPRPRSDSACSMPEICAHLSPPSPTLSSFANAQELETDFTHLFGSKNVKV